MGGALKVGDEARRDVVADAAMVGDFGRVVGDGNPVHSDPAFAAGTRFKRPIVHGTLFVGVLGALLGMDLPGPGTIYLEHHLRFLRPVYVGDRATARVSVVEALPRDRYRISTQVVGPSGELCVDGVALVWRPEAP